MYPTFQLPNFYISNVYSRNYIVLTLSSTFAPPQDHIKNFYFRFVKLYRLPPFPPFRRCFSPPDSTKNRDRVRSWFLSLLE